MADTRFGKNTLGTRGTADAVIALIPLVADGNSSLNRSWLRGEGILGLDMHFSFVILRMKLDADRRRTRSVFSFVSENG